jgi:hypothetical protein
MTNDNDHDPPVPIRFTFTLDTERQARRFLRRYAHRFAGHAYEAAPCECGGPRCPGTAHLAHFAAMVHEGCLAGTIARVEEFHAGDLRAGRYLGYEYVGPDGRLVSDEWASRAGAS